MLHKRGVRSLSIPREACHEAARSGHQVLRVRHYSYRTEQCYVAWIEQYLRFCRLTGDYADRPWLSEH
jgi:hypothetical protein